MPKIGRVGLVYKVLCGDARKVLPTFRDGLFDFIMTDPPYGHNNNNDGDLIHNWEKALGRPLKNKQTEQARPIINDSPEEANDLVRWSFGEFDRLLARGGCCCCCCGGGGPDPQFARWSLWLDEAVGFKHMVVWDKGPMGMGWHYRRSYETILVGEKKGGPCRWYGGKDVENIIRPGGRTRKIIPREDDHPCAKPVGLAEHFIRLHTRQGDLVLDPFMGHGWVGEACKRLKRGFIGVELDPKMCDIARDRINRAEPIFLPDMSRTPAFKS